MTVQFISGLFSFKQAINPKYVPGITAKYNLAVQQVGSSRAPLWGGVWQGRSYVGLVK